MPSKTIATLASSVVAATLATGLLATTATAATAPVCNPRILVHYNFSAGELPENLAAEPNGDFIVTLDLAREVVRVTPQGDQHILATLPAPANGGANVPVTGKALVTGVVRTADGTLYVGYVAGDASLSGVWRITPGQAPVRVTALPADSFANGMALDERTGELYIADSVRGVVWRVPVTGGQAEVWASGPELARTAILGPNGLKVHNGAVWVVNSDQKTLLRYPIRHDGTAGSARTVFSGHTMDDFAFVPNSDVVATTFNLEDKVALIRPDGTFHTVLTAADGLSTPTSILFESGRIYVGSSAFFTKTDPNILVADFGQING